MFFGYNFFSSISIFVILLSLIGFFLTNKKIIKIFFSFIILIGLVFNLSIFLKNSKQDADTRKNFYVGKYLLDVESSSVELIKSFSTSDTVFLMLEESGRFIINSSNPIFPDRTGDWYFKSYGEVGEAGLIYDNGVKQNLYSNWKGALIIKIPSKEDRSEFYSLYFDKL